MPKSWTEYTRDEKIEYLRSQRLDVVAQIKRNVHRAKSDGCHGYLKKIDKQLAELEA